MKKSKMSLGKRIALCIIVPVVTFAIVLGAVLALNGNGESHPPDAQQAGASASESVNTILYQDDMITVSYVKIFEEPSIADTCYLQLLVENNTDQAITVYPKDSSVNGTMTPFLSGVPMTIEAGKNSQQPFFFTYSNLSIDKMADVKDLEFKVWVTDKDTNTLLETGALKIEV